MARALLPGLVFSQAVGTQGDDSRALTEGAFFRGIDLTRSAGD